MKPSPSSAVRARYGVSTVSWNPEPCSAFDTAVLYAIPYRISSWWRHQMETSSALLALCEENPPVTSAFPSQRPVMWSFDGFFDLRLNIQLSKQSRHQWFGTPSRSLRHYNDVISYHIRQIQLYHACWWFGNVRSQAILQFGQVIGPPGKISQGARWNSRLLTLIPSPRNPCFWLYFF